MPSFSKRSIENLATCKEPLIDLFLEVVKERDCSILCGHRNEADQEKAFNDKRSYVHFPNSRHNQHPSIAVDVMPYPINWDDRLGQHEFATYVFNTAMQMGIRVQWGGLFKTRNGKIFYDAPHWQLITP